MKNRAIGKPQNLIRPEGTSPTRSSLDDPLFQLTCQNDGMYGATLKHVGTPSPVFLTCADLLGLAALVERHRAWMEEHAQANREWFHNEIAGRRVLVRLRHRSLPDEQVTLSLHTETHLAWYGTPKRANSSEANLPPGNQRIQEYLKAEWEEHGERQQFDRASRRRSRLAPRREILADPGSGSTGQSLQRRRPG